MNALEIQTLVCGAYGWFQQALIRLCVCAAVALFVVLVLRTQPVRDAAARIAALWRGAAYFTRLAVLTLLSVCVIDAGIKTNSPPLGMMMPILPQSVVQQITDQEIAQGWRLVAETNCEADIYAMPDGITPSFNWHKRGTFGEWARLDLGDFAFPLGTNGGVVTSFSIFNDGRIRPTPRDAAREICAIGVPMLAMQGASRFWTADGTSGSKLLTWENFFLNADTNLPVNAQIELFQNGDFTTRSNALERIYHRVEPFDWDGDGLENTVDPDPLVAGADAHGTNAWVDVSANGLAAPQANVEYTIVFYLDCTNRTYKASVVVDGKPRTLHAANGRKRFAFAGTATPVAGKVEFSDCKGATKLTGEYSDKRIKDGVIIVVH